MIIKATDKYKQQIFDLLQDHTYKSAKIGNFKVDDSKTMQILELVLNHGEAYISITDDDEVVGVFGGVIVEPVFNRDRIFQELFYAFKPEHTAKSGFLIRHMQKNVECDGILIVHMAGAERLARLYNALGFKELERQYIWTRNK